jgi:2-dehydro-3-deoxyphosphogluconate aldolase/(4S)-4-hydroxy-2-oxoglutarate aldolase
MNTHFDAELPIVGILRGFTSAQVTEVVGAAICGGLRNLEITMSSDESATQIRDARAVAGDSMCIGAGTVLNLELLDRALHVGAAINEDVIKQCVHRGVPVFPGAMTPTEIVRAWELGATMVKVFPAETLGPGYIKAIKAPLPHVKLMPTGGVDLKTLAAFRKAGADGFGIGGPLFDRDLIESGNFDAIEERCRAFVAAYNAPV